MRFLASMIAVCALAACALSQVRLGTDVLEAHNFDVLREARKTSGSVPPVAGKVRVGLVTNQTGLDSRGRRTIDVLARAPGIELVAIFSPEHGVTGSLDTTEIKNGHDKATGVPVYSVYGATDAKRRPSTELMKTLDAVVFDLQDAGARFYTYETTLGYFIEAASAADVRLIVLDRPNPINGIDVQGPVSDAGAPSFTDFHPIAVRHGMTVGELALMFNEETGARGDVKVVKMEGWQRSEWFDETGATWVNPSPNLRSVTEATLYPGIALIEGTNISVGRGTERPFEIVGAPWVKGSELAKFLNARQIKGVSFEAVEFTPESNQYAGQRCGGVRIRVTVTDRNALNAPALGVEVASALRRLYGKKFEIAKMKNLLAAEATLKALLAGDDPREIVRGWQDPLRHFEARRRRFLLYP